jgi:hypothetical protein
MQKTAKKKTAPSSAQPPSVNTTTVEIEMGKNKDNNQIYTSQFIYFFSLDLN